jgi:hypothetical protein
MVGLSGHIYVKATIESVEAMGKCAVPSAMSKQQLGRGQSVKGPECGAGQAWPGTCDSAAASRLWRYFGLNTSLPAPCPHSNLTLSRLESLPSDACYNTACNTTALEHPGPWVPSDH